MSIERKSGYLLSVVVPVFNEEEVIREFVHRAQAVVRGLGCRHEIIFINDGSRDRSADYLREEKAKDANLKIVHFSRNFGHQAAITAGLDYAQGDAVIILDADLQDPPELIPELVAKWREGYDIVDAQRKRRLGETIFKTWSAAIFYRLIRKLSRVQIPVDVGDYRLIDRVAVEAFKRLRESHRYIRGLIAWLGFRHTTVEYVRDKRYAGETKFPLAKMLAFSMDGITSFSVLPLRIAAWLGFFCAILAFLYLPYAVYVKWILKIAVPGWTTVIVAIFFLGGIQLLCLGIMGEYIGVLHEEVKNRPLYLVREVE